VHSAYLPLASQTQFVESAAKEAKNVSAADQSEQLRTCMAIIQSATPLTTQGVKEANKNKMLSIIESAQERTEIHKHFIVTQHDRKHNQRFNNLLFTLSKQEHFKNEQNDAKKLKVDNTLTHCKKQNVHQQAKQQHVTMAVTGLISHSKETKKRNTDG